MIFFKTAIDFLSYTFQSHNPENNQRN